MLILKKRDNNIEFRLVSCGAGCFDIAMRFGKTEIPANISCVMGQRFEDLIAKLYYLYPHQDEEFEQGEGYIDEYYYEDTLPLATSLLWDEEGAYVEWKIVRERTDNVDANLTITIKHYISTPEDLDEEIEKAFNKEYHFEVRYTDLCYAVAKFMTAVMKKHGFYGYFSSTFSADINIRQLLFLKAIALDCLEVRDLTYDGDKYDAYSNLEDEMALLLFDM